MMMRRGSYKKSEVSRNQVLEAAVVTIAAQGLGATSVSDIAAAAGLSKGAVHYHFESKDDLIRAVLARSADATRERVRAAWAQPGDPVTKLRGALREVRSLRRVGSPELRVLSHLMAEAATDHHLHQALRAHFSENRRHLVDQVLGDLEAVGVRPRVAPDVVARLMLAILDGLALQHSFDPPDGATEDGLDAAIELIAVHLCVATDPVRSPAPGPKSSPPR